MGLGADIDWKSVHQHLSDRVNGSQFRLIRLQKNVIGFRSGLRRQRSLSILFNITCKKMEGKSVC